MKRIFLFIVICIQASVLHAKGTVVGVHAFMASSKSMIAIKQTLDKCCFDVCLFDYDSRAASFCCHGEKLANYLQYIAQQRPGEPIDFVTHSTGGLVLRIALNHPCCPEEAKMGRAILLAPPNRGSSVARRFRNNPLGYLVLGTKSGAELMNWCPEDIMAIGPFPSSMEVMVIAGCRGSNLYLCPPNDNWLTIPETYLETPHVHRVISANHSQLLTSIEGRQLIVDFLSRQ